LLFYSMLPLHSDDAQRVNRLRKRADELYLTWKNS
jgi:hypothetical protein